ncbi:TPA: sortase B protein-sorting domain-containing protein [Mannheimia haemolytica]|nr:sortase B protein-sorting domain-containing protein [Mannheimia haemolytica]
MKSFAISLNSSADSARINLFACIFICIISVLML